MRSRHILFFLFTFFGATPIGAQVIKTIAGTPGTFGFSGNGGPASTALFASPYAITADRSGNLYISDWFNWCIRKIDSGQTVSVIAGNNVGGYSGDGGNALGAQINFVSDIAADQQGNLYICDYGNNRIRKIDRSGIITTVAGNGLTGDPGINGIGDGGPAIQAPLYSPLAIAVDNTGNIFIADVSKNSIRKVDTSGIITTIAGQGLMNAGYSGDGGAAVLARLSAPTGITVDRYGNLYIADLGNHRIRKINANGMISTFAGNGTAGYSGDGGPAMAASLFRPYAVIVDNHDNVYIAEDSNHVIRKISLDGIITTVAGSGVMGYSGDGGSAPQAKLTIPQRIAADDLSNLYVTDWVNHTIRKINKCAGIVLSSVSISTTTPEVCENTTVSFSAAPINGGANPQYKWTVNGQLTGTDSSFFTADNLKDGDIISCIMTSSIECTVPVESSNNIRLSVKPVPVIRLAEEIPIDPGTAIQLNPVATGNIMTVEWTPAAGLNDPYVLMPVASPVVNTTYQLSVTSTGGCTSHAKTTIVVYKKIMMPSAFTPNNDGLNDVFRIPPGTTLTLKEFSIFDRWGKKIFTTADIYKGWNGRIGNREPAAGIYVYYIKGKDPKGEIFLKGTILLLR
jgi:gliding motility-associated-like protein